MDGTSRANDKQRLLTPELHRHHARLFSEGRPAVPFSITINLPCLNVNL